MGYFHASKLLKLAFLSSLRRKYVLWKGFYHNFSTKKASPRGYAPWTPAGGTAPWTPEVPSPSLTIYPGSAPELVKWPAQAVHKGKVIDKKIFSSWRLIFLLLFHLGPTPFSFQFWQIAPFQSRKLTSPCHWLHPCSTQGWKTQSFLKRKPAQFSTIYCGFTYKKAQISSKFLNSLPKSTFSLQQAPLNSPGFFL